MFLDFKNLYPNAYKILDSEIKNNTISHAYLFEINNEKDYDFICSFVKEIVVKSGNINSEKVLNQIDKKIFDGIKMIETDLKVIKKEQIISLKSELKNINTFDNYNIYIIKDAQKMNPSASNTLLKFLEEPEDNIIGILTTNNIYSVLPTILSRCQLISLKEKNQAFDKNVDKYIDNILKLVYSIDKYKCKSLALVPDYFKDMNFEEIDEFLNILLFLYRDLLNYTMNKDLLWFCDYEKELEQIEEKNIESISSKIKALIKLIEDNYTNMNKNMLYDKMIIELSGGVNSVKC